MRCFKTTAVLSLVWCLLALVSSAYAEDQQRQSPGFEVVGPPETASLERALDRRLGGYAWGIWPRPERLHGALRGPEIPEPYVSRLRTWLPRIVRREFLPEDINPQQFYGVPRLRGPLDFIIGRLRNPVQSTVVEFQANGLSLVITAVSQNYFPDGVDGIRDREVVQAITRLVNFPEDKIQAITLEKRCERMGEGDGATSICYGKLRADGYDETKPETRDGRNVLTWWNYLPFWVSKGEIFIASTMVDWETHPANLDPYVFKLEEATQ